MATTDLILRSTSYAAATELTVGGQQMVSIGNGLHFVDAELQGKSAEVELSSGTVAPTPVALSFQSDISLTFDVLAALLTVLYLAHLVLSGAMRSRAVPVRANIARERRAERATTLCPAPSRI